MQKIYYYHFNKFDECFWAMMIAFVWAIFCCHYFCCGSGRADCSGSCCAAWAVFAFAAFLWGYKNVLKQKAVVITDKDIKVDHSKPLPWKDIKDAEIKTVNLCGRDMKVLALNPKKGINYTYSWLQKHNANFGPFPIPLYGLLTEKEEKEILQIVKKHVKVK